MMVELVPKAPEPFAPGDTVSLNCGSEWMVVLNCQGGHVRVCWHTRGGSPVEHNYPVAALYLVGKGRASRRVTPQSSVETVAATPA